MSDNPGGGRSLGGSGSSDPLPPSWGQQRPRFGRIGDWSDSSGGQRPGHAADDDDDEDEEVPRRDGESWFAGGERSGISVQNPNQRGPNPGGDAVANLLRRAAESGPPPAAASRSSAFRGGGHTLGGEDTESAYVPDPDSESETVTRTITFWRNGFQIEDGELRSYDDPANARILADLESGRAPIALLNVEVDQRVDLHIARRFQEDYRPPAGVKTFTGAGHRLGAVTPEVNTGGGSSSMPGTFPPSTATQAPSGPAPGSAERPMFEVDPTQPTTSLQIRLADGTRMVSRMNLTHTVGDIRSFINASRPENLRRAYTIGTTFPNRTLEDNSQTIKDAGLANTVIVQRWA